MHDYLLIHGLQPIYWLDNQVLGKRMIEKLVRKSLREELCGQIIFEWANDVIMFVPHLN